MSLQTGSRSWHRRWEKWGLRGSSLVVVSTFVIFGLNLLFLPLIAEKMTSDGFSRSFRWMLAALHLLAGVSLLIPRLAGKVRVWLGLVMVGVTFALLPTKEPIGPTITALLSMGLLLIALSSRLRHQADLASWNQRLSSYADRLDGRLDSSR